jgi:predicted O-methyltransferase YrrM
LTDVERSQADAPAQFVATWRMCDQVPGWLTREQAYDLWSAARKLPKDAVAIEIGSHQGRSTIALGDGARVAGATVVAIDPFLEGRRLGGQGTRARFEQHMAEADLDGIVHLEADYSKNVLARWDRRVDLLYIDGKHDYWSCTSDVDWVVHMPEGARVYVHDAFSSVGVTACLVAEMLRPNARLRYRGRSGSLAAFVTGRPTGAERRKVASELTWFSRNLIIKILLRMRLRRAARVFGHHSPYDPY